MAQDPYHDLLDRRTGDGRMNARLANLERAVEKLQQASPLHVYVTSGPPAFTPPFSGFPAYDQTNNRWYTWTAAGGWKSVALT